MGFSNGRPTSTCFIPIRFHFIFLSYESQVAIEETAERERERDVMIGSDSFKCDTLVLANHENE